MIRRCQKQGIRMITDIAKSLCQYSRTNRATCGKAYSFACARASICISGWFVTVVSWLVLAVNVASLRCDLAPRLGSHHSVSKITWLAPGRLPLRLLLYGRRARFCGGALALGRIPILRRKRDAPEYRRRL